MAITVSSLAPYASFVVAYATTATPNYKLLQQNLKSFFPKTNGQFAITNLSVPIHPAIDSTYGIHLKEKRTVTWSGGNTVQDQLNHLVGYFAKDRFVLIYVSDGELKSEIHDALFSGGITGWQPVDERVLVNAYIEGSALKTLWLGGTHRNVTVRPNSKVISGPDLTDAIDPFGDSTFVAGAVRSAKAGVSLKRSGLWFRPAKSWQDLSDLAQIVLDVLIATQAKIATLSSSVHWGLATNIFSFAGVGPAYDVEWAVSETLKGKHRARKLESLKDKFEIEMGVATVSPKDVSIVVTEISTGANCQLELQPDFQSLRIVLSFAGTYPSQFSVFVDAIKADPELIRIYYESWHTLANASLSLAAVQDRFFNLEFCDFAPAGTTYRVDLEKPPGKTVSIADILKATDLSLFKWVFKDGLAQLGLSQPAPGRCWLYCDDGSGEVADFIHVELPLNPAMGVPKIALIHVKGANSKKSTRRISAGAYEVVTAQAMKNLRRMSSISIIPELRASIAKHGGTRVWDQPWSSGLPSSVAIGTAMLTGLATITANCEYQVIVVQPHVLQTKYSTPLSNNSTAAIQLRSLLYGAQLMAQAAGAKFRVVSDQR
jgi:hypothetical protein